MTFDTLDQGIEPGGLRDIDQIQLLICYVMAKVRTALSPDDIIGMLQKNGIANYFASAQAVSELIKNGNIDADANTNGKYLISDSGIIISNQLEAELPISIKDKAVGAVLMLLEEQRKERESIVKIKKSDKGYTVSCNINDNEVTFFSFEIYVPEQSQAQAIKRNFNNHTDLVYQVMVSMLTGNKELATEVLDKLEHKHRLGNSKKHSNKQH